MPTTLSFEIVEELWRWKAAFLPPSVRTPGRPPVTPSPTAQEPCDNLSRIVAELAEAIERGIAESDRARLL